MKDVKLYIVQEIQGSNKKIAQSSDQDFQNRSDSDGLVYQRQLKADSYYAHGNLLSNESNAYGNVLPVDSNDAIMRQSVQQALLKYQLFAGKLASDRSKIDVFKHDFQAATEGTLAMLTDFKNCAITEQITKDNLSKEYIHKQVAEVKKFSGLDSDISKINASLTHVNEALERFDVTKVVANTNELVQQLHQLDCTLAGYEYPLIKASVEYDKCQKTRVARIEEKIKSISNQGVTVWTVDSSLYESLSKSKKLGSSVVLVNAQENLKLFRKDESQTQSSFQNYIPLHELPQGAAVVDVNSLSSGKLYIVGHNPYDRPYDKELKDRFLKDRLGVGTQIKEQSDLLSSKRNKFDNQIAADPLDYKVRDLLLKNVNAIYTAVSPDGFVSDAREVSLDPMRLNHIVKNVDSSMNYLFNTVCKYGALEQNINEIHGVSEQERNKFIKYQGPVPARLTEIKKHERGILQKVEQLKHLVSTNSAEVEKMVVLRDLMNKMAALDMKIAREEYGLSEIKNQIEKVNNFRAKIISQEANKAVANGVTGVWKVDDDLLKRMVGLNVYNAQNPEIKYDFITRTSMEEFASFYENNLSEKIGLNEQKYKFDYDVNSSKEEVEGIEKSNTNLDKNFKSQSFSDRTKFSSASTSKSITQDLTNRGNRQIENRALINEKIEKKGTNELLSVVNSDSNEVSKLVEQSKMSSSVVLLTKESLESKVNHKKVVNKVKAKGELRIEEKIKIPSVRALEKQVVPNKQISEFERRKLDLDQAIRIVNNEEEPPAFLLTKKTSESKTKLSSEVDKSILKKELKIDEKRVVSSMQSLDQQAVSKQKNVSSVTPKLDLDQAIRIVNNEEEPPAFLLTKKTSVSKIKLSSEVDKSILKKESKIDEKRVVSSMQSLDQQAVSKQKNVSSVTPKLDLDQAIRIVNNEEEPPFILQKQSIEDNKAMAQQESNSINDKVSATSKSSLEKGGGVVRLKSSAPAPISVPQLSAISKPTAIDDQTLVENKEAKVQVRESNSSKQKELIGENDSKISTHTVASLTSATSAALKPTLSEEKVAEIRAILSAPVTNVKSEALSKSSVVSVPKKLIESGKPKSIELRLVDLVREIRKATIVKMPQMYQKYKLLSDFSVQICKSEQKALSEKIVKARNEMIFAAEKKHSINVIGRNKTQKKGNKEIDAKKNELEKELAKKQQIRTDLLEKAGDALELRSSEIKLQKQQLKADHGISEASDAKLKIAIDNSKGSKKGVVVKKSVDDVRNRKVDSDILAAAKNAMERRKKEDEKKKDKAIKKDIEKLFKEADRDRFWGDTGASATVEKMIENMVQKRFLGGATTKMDTALAKEIMKHMDTSDYMNKFEQEYGNKMDDVMDRRMDDYVSSSSMNSYMDQMADSYISYLDSKRMDDELSARFDSHMNSYLEDRWNAINDYMDERMQERCDEIGRFLSEHNESMNQALENRYNSIFGSASMDTSRALLPGLMNS